MGLSGAVVLGTPAIAVDVVEQIAARLIVPPQPRAAWSWAQRMQVARLALALEDVHRVGSARAQRIAADARAWLASDQDTGPFSFTAICGSLSLDPAAVRRAARARLMRFGHLGNPCGADTDCDGQS